MEGRVIQFRRGRKTVHEKHFLIEIPNVNNKEKASALAGKDVKWISSAGKVIKGKIASAHGNKGVVRAIFEKGLPGQSIGTKISISDSGGKK